jgi:pilus assembly protein CpaC
LALAEAYAPEGKTRNLLEVGGVHQVMLEIRVAEMSKSLLKRLGVNMHYSRGGDFGVTTLAGLAQIPAPLTDANMLVGPAGDNPALYAQTSLGALVSPAVNAIFRFHHNGATWTNFVDALQEDGLAKILAEPTLVAMSGQSASFLAGGEYPVPVPQGDGDITIDYKEFGVKLSFTPTVMSDNKISIKVTPEVSELDFSTAVQFSGFVVPGITTRKVSTMVELADGQSFAIAGLLSENVREVISKYPILGDIPILGNLFRSRGFQKKETELIIIATPHLVKPLNMEEQTLPTDYYIEPNDMESYILGLSEGREKKTDKDQLSKSEAKLDGDFGHAMPDSR